MTAEEEHGQLRAAVSNAIVGVYTDSRTRADQGQDPVFDDYILCVCGGSAHHRRADPRRAGRGGPSERCA